MNRLGGERRVGHDGTPYESISRDTINFTRTSPNSPRPPNYKFQKYRLPNPLPCKSDDFAHTGP